MADGKKTVLITGCSPGGIGHALALEFHGKGCYVIATARDISKLESLSSRGIKTLELDVTSPENIVKVKEEVTQITGGKLDYLVNNAGRNYTVPALDIDLDEVREMFETNVFAVMRMCQVFTPLLIEAKGCIVQIGSLAGIMPYVFGSTYNASKAALHAYSNTLRVELAPFGVRVVTIVTGGVKSNIARVDRILKEDSLYQPIKEEYARRVKHSQEVGMDTTQYAKSVTRQVLQSRPAKWIWEGGSSRLVWFVTTFLPQGIMDFVMTRMFRLWKLKTHNKHK
ncbi:hypothetical protein VTO42DRAFT_8347 [Malbranchea cinnamomea]